jgi:hypothetical protein
MSNALAFRISRLALGAAALTAIAPPVACTSVSIANGTVGDLQLHTNDNSLEYQVIAPGYERTVTLERGLFMPGTTAFWLNALSGGLVVVQWF